MKDTNKYADLATGIGNLCTGVAALLAVFFAKEPVTNYINKISQQQTQSQAQTATVNTTINLSQGIKQVHDLATEQDPKAIDHLLDQAAAPPSGNSHPTGLFIAPEFHSPLKKELESAPNFEKKQEIISNYWQKSLSRERGIKIYPGAADEK